MSPWECYRPAQSPHVTRAQCRCGWLPCHLSGGKTIHVSLLESEWIALLTQLAEFPGSCAAVFHIERYKEDVGIRLHSFSFISKKHKRHKIALRWSMYRRRMTVYTAGIYSRAYYLSFSFLSSFFCQSSSGNLSKECESQRLWVRWGFPQGR